MMISRLSILLACTTGLTALAATPALAQENSRDGLAACRAQVDNMARLTCYDRLADSVVETVSETEQFGAPQRAPTPEVTPPAQERRGFGIRRLIPGLGNRDEQQTAEVLDSGDDAVEEFGQHTQPHGYAISDAPFAEGAQVLERNDRGEITRVRMPIRSYRVVGYGTHVFTMENGQVWRQQGSDRVRVPSGELFADIRVASLGSYLMRINGEGSAIRVRRQGD